MRTCTNCQREVNDEISFCPYCGTPLTEAALSEEQAFIDTTHRILRWERKAWSIAGKACLIMGIIFAVIFFLYGLIFLALGETSYTFFGEITANVFTILFFVYSFVFGGLLIALGIISRVAANKTVQYLDSMYTDFRPTLNRCGSVGMMIVSILFGVVSPIFFIINFVRMKANKELIQRILNRQNSAE